MKLRRILFATLQRATLAGLALGLIFFGTGCKPAPSGRLSGYIEGEYVYIASPLAGRLEKLSVARGSEVKKGAPLFTLESVAEQAAHDEAQRRLAQAKANLADLKKGSRPSELAALEAQLKQAKAALTLSIEQFDRQQKLITTGASSTEDLDKARSTHDQNLMRVQQLEAEYQTAQLGAREDQIQAAESEVQARAAALAKTQWDLDQKQQCATADGLIFDTLYREGEWIAAGKPIIVLLPPPNIKLRAYVSQERVGTLHLGDKVSVYVDGIAEPLTSRITFISPQAEYTPPVIYSLESRDKFVYLIEARFDDAVAVKLHPGQPVDVTFDP